MHKSTVYSIYCNGFRNIRGYYSIVADSRFVRIQRFAIKSRCVQNLAKNKKFFLFAAYTMSYTRSFVTHVSSSQNQVIKCTQGGICCTFVLPHKIPQIKCLWNYNLSISFFLVNLCTISNVVDDLDDDWLVLWILHIFIQYHRIDLYSHWDEIVRRTFCNLISWYCWMNILY